MGRKISVRANYFEVTTLPSNIYHYDFIIIPQPIAHEYRLVYQQVDQIIQNLGIRSVFDGRRNIYTNRQLPNFIMNISNVNVTIPGINVSRSFNVRINKVATINLRDLRRCFDGKSPISTSVLTG